MRRSKKPLYSITSVGIEPTRLCAVEDAREFLAGKGVDVDALAPQVERKFMSAFIRAVKPVQEAEKTTEVTRARLVAVADPGEADVIGSERSTRSVGRSQQPAPQRQ
jgi:hypothetical protein